MQHIHPAGTSRHAVAKQRVPNCPACYARQAARADRQKASGTYTHGLLLKWARRYGITVADVKALGDTCAICGDPGEVIDHDHSTGRVRGLLCKPCNFMLGHAKDDVNRLAKAIDYLTR